MTSEKRASNPATHSSLLPSPYFSDYSSPSASSMPTSKDSDSETGDLTRRNEICVKGGQGPLYRTVTIGTLPDDALLEIFSFYMNEVYEACRVNFLEEWHTLVHVCQRWRGVVFASPRRLNLRVVCTSRRPAREMQHIWPTLPIVIEDWKLCDHPLLATENVDNIVAAFRHRNRIYEIDLDPLPLFFLERITPMMQESFPTLTFLTLRSQVESATVLPDSFLGGCAPRLLDLTLDGIPFPGLPKLLLSTNNLVELCLRNIPHCGYISPEAMATCLSSLTNLRTLALDFNFSQTRPDDLSRSLPSLTRVDLPTLFDFQFNGAHDYIEDFVARINAPLLCDVQLSFSYQPLFDVTQLCQFIGRTEGFDVFHQAYITFYQGAIFIRFENTVHITSLELQIACIELDAQLSSLAQVCHQISSPILFYMEHLEIVVDFPPPYNWDDYTENTLWLWSRFLQPFTAVRNLYLPQELVFRVVRALQEPNGESSEELLPRLWCMFVEGNQSLWDVQAAIRPFTAARQDSGHPVAIHRWKQWQEDDEWSLASSDVAMMTSEIRSLLQLSPYFTDYASASASTTPTSERSNAGSHQRTEFWVEDGQGSLNQTVAVGPIGSLPDEVLLEIFSFYLEEAYKADSADRLEAWRILAHVCHRWRKNVFASPRRLNLQLVCTSRKPVREMLGIWPTLPIVIKDWDLDSDLWLDMYDVDNIMAALEHRDRVCQIALESVPHFLLEWDSVMMESFPALTHLFLSKDVTSFPVLPESFLGGSAPRLRELVLEGVSFPALPKLLLSTNDLVELCLWSTPHSGYISPDAMVTCLSSLTRLEMLCLGFNSSESLPDESSRRPPSLTRVNLPSLLKFQIHGRNEYIEDFVAGINAPQLFRIDISCFYFGGLDFPQLSQFIDRIDNFKALHQARVRLCDEAAYIKFANTAHTTTLEFRIPYLDAESQPPSLVELCRSFQSPIGPSMERLEIVVDDPPADGWHDDDIESDMWFGLLRHFTSVKDLYLSEGLALRVLQAMQELIKENTTQVLPALQNIFIEGHHHFSEAAHAVILLFIAVRPIPDTVTVHRWDRRQEDDD